MRCLILIIFSLASVMALAQHNNRSARDLQFRFGNPGARSLGLGGAFVALADDATAPVANPAGMVRTEKRSFSLELNASRDENEVPFAGGRVVQTNLFELDYQLETESFPETTFRAPYTAVVWPSNAWRFSVFAHQQADVLREYNTDFIYVCLLRDEDCVDNPNFAFAPGRDILDMEIWNLGVSVGRALTDRVSVGLSVFHADLDYRSDTVSDLPTATSTVRVEKLARGNDTDSGLIAGMLWRATDALSVGGTYKHQPSFDYTAILNADRPVTGVPANFETVSPFNIPDSLALGISINPVDQATLNLDVNRVYYSQITDDFIDFIFEGGLESDITQELDDVTEIHLGFEWVFLSLPNPLSFRVGYWLDPYHAPINSVEDSQLLGESVSDPNLRDIFFLEQFTHDTNHYSVGLGWTFGLKLQLDLAFEYSERSTNGTVSGIYRF